MKNISTVAFMTLMFLALQACSGGGGGGDSDSGLSDVTENEPNDSTANAQTLQSNVSVTGSTNGGGFFRELEPNGNPTGADAQGASRIGENWRGEVLRDNTDCGMSTDCVDLFSFIPTVGGTYQISLSGFDGPTNDLDLYVIDGSLTQIADSASPTDDPESVTVNVTAGAQYYIEVQGFSMMTAPVGYTLRIIGADTDEFDVYRFVPNSSDNFELRLTGFGAQDLDLYIFNETFDEGLVSNADAGMDETLDVALEGGETYFILVQAWNTSGNPTSYTLTLQGGGATGTDPGTTVNPIDGGGPK